MHAIRRATERGLTDLGWLTSRHSFSFGSYHNADHMGFGVLRVINEDHVAPGQGFGTHGHQDMEIISYVVSGALEHQDSLGTGSTIRPGDVQRMSAGTGVMHSEFNASTTEPVHFLQIWIEPNQAGLVPSYEQRNFALDDEDVLQLVASPDGEAGSLSVNQDVRIFKGSFSAGQTAQHVLNDGRKGWLQVVDGQVEIDQDTQLAAGDGLAVDKQSGLSIRAVAASELLLFDLP